MPAEDPTALSTESLRRSRAEIKGTLLRISTAALLIVCAVVGLAIVAMVAGFQSNRHAASAVAASRRAQEELWKSYVAQAEAERLTGLMGRKSAGQEVIAAAARIRPAVELRTEAIAHLALLDFAEAGPLHEWDEGKPLCFDHAMTRFLTRTGDGFSMRALETAAELRRVTVTNGSISFITFSLDDRFLVFFCARELWVLNAQSGAVQCRLRDVAIFDFFPDQRSIAVMTGDSVIRWHELETGQPTGRTLRLPTRPQDFLFDPAGTRLLLNFGKELQVVDARTGALQRTLDHPTTVTHMAWSRHDHIAGGDMDGGIEVWNLRSGQSFFLHGHDENIAHLTFHPKGDLLCSFSFDGTTRIWNPFTGKELLTTHRGFGVQFSADGRFLGYRTATGAGVWRVLAPQGLRSVYCVDSAAANIYHIDFSPDGEHLAVMKDDGLRIVHLPSDEIVARRPMRRGRTAHFLPGGRLLTCGDHRLSIWPLKFAESASGDVELGEPRHITLPSTQHVDSAVMDLARTRCVLPISDGRALLVDLDHPEQPISLRGTRIPKQASFSRDGRWIATGTFHGDGANLWEAATGRWIRKLYPQNCSVFFHPTENILVIAGNREYVFLETGTWRVVKRIASGTAGDLPNAAAFTRDGSLLALTRERSTIELLDAKTFDTLAKLIAPEVHAISALTFDTTGDRLAAATTRSIVQLWNLREIRTALGPLNLDWEANTGVKPSRRGGGSAPEKNRALALAVGGTVAAVIACALFLLSKQRRLLGRYLALDSMLEQQNRNLERAQAEILHSQKMTALGTLAAGIAHDFNNLLSVIRMSNKLISRQSPSDPEIQENAKEIEHAVQQGKNVVRSMLGYSRTATEGATAVSLPELVEDTLGMLSRQFLSGIALRLELDRDIPAVRASRARLEQILLNLIVNASEAMNGKGTLTIMVRRSIRTDREYLLRAAPAERHVEVVVADSGPGIAPEILPRIFEPFYTTKVVGATRGTGLGLSMVHRMAENEGFGIAVSTGTGQGTAFHIIVPVRNATPAPAPDYA